ncbi:hypothetical protein PF006_g3251 [Phytophthora fragariae]|uniref:Uncharacterized protein n=1 Tax=Phytophthora fragariae TaxID=53985 RepID=A0A6A3FMG1_9STRA|nr:hypothetical protein PF009_g3960 [Phytophthora fragariae]KAE9152549.1 hypothetical protein PF006_g3251 [Phytophthora fragariae]
MSVRSTHCINQQITARKALQQYRRPLPSACPPVPNVISSTKKLASEDYADMITTHDHDDFASAGDDTDNATTKVELREIDSLQ